MPHIGEKAQVQTEMPRSMSAESVAMTGSPFTYTATRNGMLFVAGGTLSVMTYARGATLLALGLSNGPITMVTGDKVNMTYLTAPTLTFLPTA